MTNKQKLKIACSAAQAAGALVALIGLIGEAIVKHKKS